ncbi:MAG: response regulator [Candidatus Omnitrophota bacterium]|nr:MAG: response regulator [Candidatus Omnitrophota bacterium]
MIKCVLYFCCKLKKVLKGAKMDQAKLKLLIVDDEKEVCEYTASHLKRKGYDALVANAPEEAITVIKEQNPDLMILDMNLPGMSGADLLKIVRQFNTSVKVIMISGYPLDIQKDPQFSGLNISEFMQKPVPLSALDSMLAKITNKEKDGHTQIDS